MEAAAAIAVASTATIPQIGFVHEDSGQSFILDIADLGRHDVTLPIAFGAAKQLLQGKDDNLERTVRRRAAEVFNRDRVVSTLIEHIKDLLSPPVAGDVAEPKPNNASGSTDATDTRDQKKRG